MKLLVISHLYPPLHGGTFDFRSQSIAEALQKRGHEVKVLTSTLGLTGEQRDFDIERRLRMNGFLQPLTAAYGELKELEVHNNAVVRETIAAFQPDLVHVFSLNGISKSLIFTLRNSKVPTVYDIYDEWLSEGVKDDPWLRWWNAPSLGFAAGSHRKSLELSGQRDRLTGVAPTRMMKGYERIPELYGENSAEVKPGAIGAFIFERLYFCSEALKSRAEKSGFRVAHADVIHPGIPTDRFYADLKPPSHLPKKFLVVSRLSEKSGVLTALEGLRLALQNGVQASLTVYGRGESEHMAQIRSFVVQHSLPVEFISATNQQKELAQVYRSHDAFIYCAEWDEPFPMTILEAMGSGLPVIASRTEGAKELLRRGENAWVYTPGDALEVASRMQEIQMQPHLRHQVAEAAQTEVMSRFSESYMIDQIEAYLNTTLEVWQYA